MPQETIGILTNKEVIAVNQDSLGIQGFQYSENNKLETWFKPLKDGNWAVCFLNRNDSPQPVNFDWTTEIVQDSLAKRNLDNRAGAYNIRNLWTKKELGTTKKALKTVVPSHDVLMLHLRKN